MFRKNASATIGFVMPTTAGALDAAPTVIGNRTRDNDTLSSVTGNFINKGGGQMLLVTSSDDLNGTSCAFYFQSSGDVPIALTVLTTAANPQDAVRFGLSALPNAAAGAAGGLHILGSNAGPVTYAALTIGSGLSIGGAVQILGNFSIAGTTSLVGNVLLSDGLTVAAPSTTNRAGVTIGGNGSGGAVKLTPGATGVGLEILGGATSGSAVKFTGTAGNAIALELVGQGNKAGLSATGGSSGIGVEVQGGVNANGMSITGGSGGNGFQVQGGNSGTGFVAIAGSGGSSALFNGHTSFATVATSGAVTLSSLTITNAFLATNAGNDIRGVLLAGTQTFNNTGTWNGDLNGNVLGSVQGNIGGFLSLLGVGALSAAAVSAAAATKIADAGFDEANGVEAGLTHRQTLRLLAASQAGPTSGMGTTNCFIFPAQSGSATPRISATVDSVGNRSNLILNLNSA